MRMIIYLFWVIIVTITTRPILAIPRPPFVGEYHNNPSSPRSRSLNATVNLAMASGARTSDETMSKIQIGTVFLKKEVATLTNISYPTAISSQVQQNSQWGPGGISTVVFGCIASILGMLAIWATIWLGHRQLSSNRPSVDAADEATLQDLPNDQASDVATAGSSEGGQQHESLGAPIHSVAGE